MAGERRRLRAVRVRATVVAALAVGLALIAGGAALVVGLRVELSNDVRDAARVRAREVARVIEAGRGVPEVSVADAEEEFLQVVDERGTVVAASSNIEGLPALARLRPGGSTEADTPIDEDPFLVVAVGARDGDRRLTVLDGRTPAGVAEATSTVTRMLLVGVPVLLVLASAATWVAVGRTLRRVAHAEAAQRRFVSDASHELRSPVATVRQHAEVALAHPGRTDAGALAGTVLDEAVRMQHFVDDLLLLARADEDAIRPARRPVDLDDLVFDEARRLRERQDGPRVDSAGVSAGRVLGDEDALRRVVRNLGENAARHARSRVALTLGEAGGTVRLDVDDDGPGVPEGERARVFGRFVRLDEARARGEGGAGLGLAIVAELVAAHGGTVTVETAPELGGARFTVKLPATD
ncbi:cell wall metabolism sensor histidine kinase WalK [Streptomyces sp. NBC_00140]|uniref:sensor histidine kinase n=1 Tax=Streptomyces sp. NBC_00140 TaxID=2975664 RepID=UPI0022575962|nr:HAMP domain-containing sensor histidine kinase [Streptomyces sp. NBC_00140]MCX5327962.1 HAMP domain-containing histidine kinase [Streptomyces sp. NBC_00140]